MNPTRFQHLTSAYSNLRVAVVGDFCLDRYLEIDPSKKEISIETGLPVFNVVNVRPQPGGAGTILNNLSALGIGSLHPIGFCGRDGEGAELLQALAQRPGVRLDSFLQTAERRTFTYCKPLIVSPGAPPKELNRLDSKNWTPTPASVQDALIQSILGVAGSIDAIILLDQVDIPETGVVTQKVLTTVKKLVEENPRLLVIADSRRGLRGYPPVVFKMNAAELAALTGRKGDSGLESIQASAIELARTNSRHVFVTLSERGLIGAAPDGKVEQVPTLPLRGEIDVVGAGDAVTANLTASLAAGADLREALEIANAAASVVVHKLGTTGTASIAEVAELLLGKAASG